MFQQQKQQTTKVFRDGLSTLPTTSTPKSQTIRFVNGQPQSWIHCVGENFLRNHWVLKSCQFAHLCWQDEFDEQTSQKSGQFNIYPVATSRRNTTRLSPYARSSTDPSHQQVSVSALMPTWIAEQRHQWFPHVVDDDEEGLEYNSNGYYELPASIVWVPMTFDPAFLQRASSILFDILLPLYTLTTIFGWEDLSILLTPLNPSECLDSPDTCYPPVLQQYLQLVNLATIPSIHSNQQSGSRRICARRAAAGVGALSDHGNKRHGERPADYQTSHIVGKGPLLWRFREYALKNARIKSSRVSSSDPATAKVVLAFLSNPEFATLASYLQKQDDLLQGTHIQLVDLNTLTLRQQLSLAVQTSFWISKVGEASIPAFFMDRNGTLILYYDTRIHKSNRPALLHWDLWNHASHLTIHWLPATSSETSAGLLLLEQVLRLQLKFLSGKSKAGGDYTPKSSKTLSALGHDLTWVPNGLGIASSSHCLGDNFIGAQAPCYRSCLYRHLCLDIQHRQFQLSLSKDQEQLQRYIEEVDDGFSVISINLNQTLMEGRNVRFTQNEPWAPTVVSSGDSGYFSLPSDMFWIPYTLDASFAANLGHFCWDFLLPFFTLLSMYGYDGMDGRANKTLLLTSLDDKCRNTPKCAGLVKKFLPLVGSTEIYTTDNLNIKGVGNPDSVSRVCSPYGAAGIGMLTDHGSTRHGQTLDDYQRVQNPGRGAHFYAFRNFMLRNIGIDDSTLSKRSRHGVLFSVNSSTSLPRRKTFAKQITAAQNSLADISFVSGVEFARFPLRDQLLAITQASVLVSTTGGSTASAMFLPRHASLILYFSSDESFVRRSRKEDFPTMMDFDFWNNASYLRVHWLPTGSMDEDFHLKFLVDLIRSELEQTERFILDEK